MVENNNEPLDAIFHALADPTRREMLRDLAIAPRTIGELAAPFAISLAAASKHIKVLERAGLLSREINGRSHICRLNAQPMYGGLEWIRHYERFWHERIDALESMLKREDDEHDAASASSPSGSLPVSPGNAAGEYGYPPESEGEPT